MLVVLVWLTELVELCAPGEPLVCLLDSATALKVARCLPRLDRPLPSGVVVVAGGSLVVDVVASIALVVGAPGCFVLVVSVLVVVGTGFGVVLVASLELSAAADAPERSEFTGTITGTTLVGAA